MSRKTCILIFISILLVVLCGCGAQSGAEHPANTPSPTAEPTPEPTKEPVSLSISLTDEHPAFLTLDEYGCFRFYKNVTRMEVCQALYTVLEGWPGGSYRFSDMSAAQPGCAAAAALCREGIVPVPAGEAFLPDAEVTREELTGILEELSRHLEGEALTRVEELTAEVREGSLAWSEKAQAGISRVEFAQIIVRLSGRTPNEAALMIGDYLPVDVDMESYAWLYIADAVTEGVLPAPEEGVYRVEGILYGVGPDGELLRDTDYGVWTFGPDGRYTTGDADLDACIRAALESCGADELSDEKALKAVYLHVKYDYEYLVTPADMVVEEPAATGWENERALRFFQNGGGTCYGFAAAFGLLARSIGEHAYIVSAQVNQYYAPHGFVVIPEDGVDWIYDVEMEATRMERHKDLELFRIKNYGIYNYWYTPDW